MRRSGATARECDLADLCPGCGQDIDMAAMFKAHAFVKGAQQMTFIMPAGEAIKAAALMCPVPAAVKEGMEHRIVRSHDRLAHEAVDLAERVVMVTLPLDEAADIPFQIGG